MKKIAFILALVTACLSATAQDTLEIGYRNPVYYYWDTNWFDHYIQNPCCDMPVKWYYNPWGGAEDCKPEYARYFYTDTALRIIGLAGVPAPFIWNGNGHDDSIAYKNMLPEYFRLYETDSNGGMELIGEGRWTHRPTAHYMYVTYNTQPIIYREVKEIYFDSARTVRDSFYVSMTMNNDCEDDRPWPIITFGMHIASADLDSLPGTPLPSCAPHPNHFERRVHLLDSRNVDERYGFTDYEWHTLTKVAAPFSWETPSDVADLNAFFFLFPIIDTSREGLPMVLDSCQAPTGFSCAFSQYGTAVFSWDIGTASDWDLSIAPLGSTPEQGSLTHCTSNIATITGLDTTKCYTAWVRTRCQNNVRSHWSDSVDFCMNGGTAAVPSVVDSHTFLFPNPASDQVQVASSFRISTVEVYSLSGQLVSRVKADGISATLDTRSLPSATYLVRITTNHGITVKKLVVE